MKVYYKDDTLAAVRKLSDAELVHEYQANLPDAFDVVAEAIVAACRKVAKERRLNLEKTNDR